MGKIAKTNPLHLAAIKHHEDRKAMKAAGIKPMSPAVAALAHAGRGAGARQRSGQMGEN